MTGKLVFLLEEESSKRLLEGLLPRLYPELDFLCVAHEGKSDLERSIPRKLRAWREPGVRFLIARDNDGGDCVELKRKLTRLCEEGGRADSVVRIACQEIEAWYLGDSNALADAYDDDRLRGIERKARFRNPDAVTKPSDALRSLVPKFQKISGARLMAARLAPEGNRSASFQALLRGIEKLQGEMSGPAAPGERFRLAGMTARRGM